MKKFFGWTISIISGILIFIFSIGLLTLFTSERSGFTKDALFSTRFSSIIFICLMVLLLLYGIKLIKTRKPAETKPYNGVLNIELNGKIDFIEYRNTILQTLYGPRSVIILLLFILIMGSNIYNNSDDMFNWIFVTIIPIVFIYAGFRLITQLKKTFKENPIFKEVLKIHLTNESLHLKGESIDAVIKWNFYIKVKETKHFFILYQSNTTATFLTKRFFSQNDLSEFRNFILSLNIIRVK